MAIIPAGRGPELLATVGLVFIVKSFGFDDYSAVAAWILFILYSTFAISGVHNGTGQHAADIPQAVLPVGLKVTNTHLQEDGLG
ncbi:hypothetical protein V493_01019 [Pseudogymnoascus sp. VKM F-4281 (FW-2241)]|nr:hypothetical protein V493_01019 [Pseudogymnoascus sp. VKM F-4281 (FW-2241)]